MRDVASRHIHKQPRHADSGLIALDGNSVAGVTAVTDDRVRVQSWTA